MINTSERDAEFTKDLNQTRQRLGLACRDMLESPTHGIDAEAIQESCLLIKGDNLVALRGLLAGKNKIDFCYIDPPYNTGQSFIYSDKWPVKSESIWGEHSSWMAFMLSRLIAAKHLLTMQGVIAISIDDYAYAHLKVMMDAVFGGSNFIANLIVCRSKNGKGSRADVAINHEYVLVYGRTKSAELMGLPELESSEYPKKDGFGQYKVDGMFRKKGDASLRTDRPNMYYPLYYTEDGVVSVQPYGQNSKCVYPMDSKGVERRWLWGIEKAAAESWKLYASKNGTIYVKNYQVANKRIKLRSILDSSGYLTDRATSEQKEVFGEKIFETPKPISLVKDLIDCCASKNATVLDFFAGTGTTAIAVHQLNERDNAARKTILVEHALAIASNHVAAKKGFKFTSDITEARLQHAASVSQAFTYRCLSL